MPDTTPPPAPAGNPLSVGPQEVIAELEAIPEARPYWQLAQERAVRKALAARVEEQEQELQQLRNAAARTARAATDS